MPSALSHPVDTSEFPAYFSLLPVRVHHEAKAIDEAALEAINICAPEGSKVRKSALRRLCNPLGGPYILCFPESETEKLKLFAQCFELFWTHDGEALWFSLLPSRWVVADGFLNRYHRRPPTQCRST